MKRIRRFSILLVALLLLAAWLPPRRERHAGKPERPSAPAEATPAVVIASAAPQSVDAGEPVPEAVPASVLIVTVRDAVTGHTVDSCVVTAEYDHEVPCDRRGIATVQLKYTRDSERVTVVSRGYVQQRLNVTLSRGRTEFEVLMVRGGAVSGILVGESDEPIADERVEATTSLGGLNQVDMHVQSDAAGHFEFDGLEPGLVHFEADVSDADDLRSGALEVRVAPGEVRSGVRLVVKGGGTIVGRVLTPDGRPVGKDVAVHVTAATPPGRGDDSKTDTTGSFTFRMPPGLFTLTAKEGEERSAFLSPVAVERGKPTQVTLTLASQTIDGFVHDSAGHPLAAVGVEVLAGMTSSLAFTHSDAAGRFHFGNLAGDAFMLTACRDDNWDQILLLPGVKLGAHVDVLLPLPGKLSGLVLDPDGRTAAGCTVKLALRGRRPGVASGGNFGGGLFPRPVGCNFVWDNVTPGTYDVIATAPGRAEGRTTTIIDEGRTTEVTLRLGAGATITGHVTEDGRAVAGCVVGIGAITTSDGAFELPGLPDGRTHLTAMCPDGAGGATDISVENGQAKGDITIAVTSGPRDDPPKADFGGIGATLNTVDGYPTVQSAMDDTPSSEAGLEAGDTIIAVNGKSASGVDLRAIIEQIRGPIGSSLVLTIRRAGVAEPFDVYLQRGRIVVQ